MPTKLRVAVAVEELVMSWNEKSKRARTSKPDASWPSPELSTATACESELQLEPFSERILTYDPEAYPFSSIARRILLPSGPDNLPLERLHEAASDELEGLPAYAQAQAAEEKPAHTHAPAPGNVAGLTKTSRQGGTTGLALGSSGPRKNAFAKRLIRAQSEDSPEVQEFMRLYFRFCAEVILPHLGGELCDVGERGALGFSGSHRRSSKTQIRPKIETRKKS